MIAIIGGLAATVWFLVRDRLNLKASVTSLTAQVESSRAQALALASQDGSVKGSGSGLGNVTLADVAPYWDATLVTDIFPGLNAVVSSGGFTGITMDAKALDVQYSGFNNRESLVTQDAKLVYVLTSTETKVKILVYDTHEDFLIIALDPVTKRGTLIAHSGAVSYTGNSGAVWMPVAIRKDGKAVIMRAIMASPGAGGSSVDYGFAQLAIAPTTGNAKLWVKGIAQGSEIPGVPVFYDGYTKALSSVPAGEPEECPPCFFASSDLIAMDLLDGTKKTVSTGQKNTSYRPVSVDAGKGSVSVEVISYTSPAGCTSLSCRVVSSKETKTFSL